MLSKNKKRCRDAWEGEEGAGLANLMSSCVGTTMLALVPWFVEHQCLARKISLQCEELCSCQSKRCRVNDLALAIGGMQLAPRTTLWQPIPSPFMAWRHTGAGARTPLSTAAASADGQLLSLRMDENFPHECTSAGGGPRFDDVSWAGFWLVFGLLCRHTASTPITAGMHTSGAQ